MSKQRDLTAYYQSISEMGRLAIARGLKLRYNSVIHSSSSSLARCSLGSASSHE